MARTIDLKKILVTGAVGSAVIVGAAAAFFVFPIDRLLRLANIAIPLATLWMLWIIWLRQRRIAKLAQARLKEAADPYARVAALREAIKDKCLSARQTPLDMGVSHNGEDFPNRKNNGPTIH